jgi:hypothetical protein
MEALAGGATREPTIERIDGANAMVNDADLMCLRCVRFPDRAHARQH